MLRLTFTITFTIALTLHVLTARVTALTASDHQGWTVDSVPLFANTSACNSVPGFVCDPDFKLTQEIRTSLEMDFSESRDTGLYFCHRADGYVQFSAAVYASIQNSSNVTAQDYANQIAAKLVFSKPLQNNPCEQSFVIVVSVQEKVIGLGMTPIIASYFTATKRTSITTKALEAWTTDNLQPVIESILSDSKATIAASKTSGFGNMSTDTSIIFVIAVSAALLIVVVMSTVAVRVILSKRAAGEVIDSTLYERN